MIVPVVHQDQDDQVGLVLHQIPNYSTYEQ